MQCSLYGAGKMQQQLLPESVSLSAEKLDSDACKLQTALYHNFCSKLHACHHIYMYVQASPISPFDHSNDGTGHNGDAVARLADILRASASSRGGGEGSPAESASAEGRRLRGGHPLQPLPTNTRIMIEF